jgi:hypothetical protein
MSNTFNSDPQSPWHHFATNKSNDIFFVSDFAQRCSILEDEEKCLQNEGSINQNTTKPTLAAEAQPLPFIYQDSPFKGSMDFE